MLKQKAFVYKCLLVSALSIVLIFYQNFGGSSKNLPCYENKKQRPLCFNLSSKYYVRHDLNNSSKSIKSINEHIKIMTYNVHGFTDKNNVDSLIRIADVIKNENPDLIALQEVKLVVDSNGNQIYQIEELMKKLKNNGQRIYNYIYVPAEHIGKSDGLSDLYIGNAVLSKFPISYIGEMTLPQGSEGRRGSKERREALTVKVRPVKRDPSKDLIFISTHLGTFNDVLFVAPNVVDPNQGRSAEIILDFVKYYSDTQIFRFDHLPHLMI